MARISEVIRFSEYFRIDPALITMEGAIDPILNYDSKYFIDPMLLALSEAPELREDGAEMLRNHFEMLYDLLRGCARRGDVAWQGAARLFNGREVSSINLGYGSRSTGGSSMPAFLAAQLLDTARQIIALGITNPNLFLVLPLLHDGVGPDSVSDITAAAVLPALARFTTRVLEACPDLPRRRFSVGTPAQDFHLPAHPYQHGPIILVPEDCVRELPIATSWDDIGTVCAQAADLREKFNQLIMVIFRDRVDDDRLSKETARKAVLASSDVSDQLVSLIDQLRTSVEQLVTKTTPDDIAFGAIKNDALLNESLTTQWKSPTSAEEALALVRRIVADYRFLIEERRLSELLYKENKRPRRERFAQMLFFAVAYARCRAYDLDVTPEADTGNGPVDFKFSKGFRTRIVVEIKLSTNGQAIHGVETQLPRYARAEQTEHGIYVFIDVGRAGKKWEKISDLVREHRPANVVEAHYIDGLLRPSASNE